MKQLNKYYNYLCKRSFDCLFSCSRAGILCLALFFASCGSVQNINGVNVRAHKDTPRKEIFLIMAGSFLGYAIVVNYRDHYKQ